MKKQETLSLPEGGEAAVKRISGALAKLIGILSDPDAGELQQRRKSQICQSRC